MEKKEETYGYSREHLLAFICADPRDITTVEKICKFIYMTFFFCFFGEDICVTYDYEAVNVSYLAQSYSLREK